MKFRSLGRTGYDVSEISFGCWAIGGSWGDVDDSESLVALNRALDLGVNFFDTADVYGDGRSERLLARLRRERSEPFYIATKLGRRLDPHVASGYTKANMSAFVERSLRNLEVEALDLVQLHCPPSEVFENESVFEALEELVQAGKLRAYGVSVEKVSEAMRALQYPNMQSVQIIFNAFRLKPSEAFFAAARERQVGIIARVPLASGLLTGKLSRQSQFAADDHRSFNRNGESFDKGETFSGVNYELGLQAVEEIRALLPEGMTMAQFALRWILMFPEVTCAIPGAKNAAQAEANIAAADFPPISEESMRKVADIYDRLIRPEVHHLW
jgi:aryl-alcohol dehydrogenase-like predicted oxidoreductase